MPRVPIDYSKTIIYHFVCNDTLITDTYVGHTTDFRKRKYGHKSCCNNEEYRDYNFKLYQNIRANGGWENWEMKPLEEFNCENKIQARIREQEWIDKLQAKMNSVNSFKDKKEYCKEFYEEHKKEIRERHNIYNKEHKEERNERYQKNKEKILEKNKEKFTCECGVICRITDKSRHEKSQKHINSMANI